MHSKNEFRRSCVLSGWFWFAIEAISFDESIDQNFELSSKSRLPFVTLKIVLRHGQ